MRKTDNFFMKRFLFLVFIGIFAGQSFLFAKGKADVNFEETLTQQNEVTVSENAQAEEEVLEEEVVESKEPVQLYSLRPVEGEPVGFAEVWGFVNKGSESAYNSSLPITDVCYFSAEINSYGELTGAPVRSKLKTGKARCHMVVACDNAAILHFILDPEYDLRKPLLKAIVKAAAAFDGVNIDFENVPSRDRKNFLNFIADLRYMLGSAKWFSVCVPARFKLLSNDIYPYAEVASFCDRVFIMAYDQHWSTSAAGPIAAVDWSEQILPYAQKAIPEKKLVMGIPFYGRIWADTSTSGAYIFTSMNKRMIENGVEEVVYENDIPSFEYDTTVHVTGYFNDAYSDIALLRMYKSSGVKKIGFWRVGQEDPEFWNWLEIKK